MYIIYFKLLTIIQIIIQVNKEEKLYWKERITPHGCITAQYNTIPT